MNPHSFHREAREEYAEAAKHYAGIDPALGHRFYAVIDQLIDEACQSPGTFHFIRKPPADTSPASSLTASSTSNAPTISGSSPSCLSAENPVTGSTA